LRAQNSDNGSDNGTSLKAIKQAVDKNHHNNPCIDENCREVKKGYMTLQNNMPIYFFDLIYTIDEPFKFDHSQRHEYTVKANENLPDKYIDNNRYCYTIENEVRKIPFLFSVYFNSN
jgi:hypothetical protein